MIVNRGDPEVSARIEGLGGSPEYSRILALAASSESPMRLEASASHLELAGTSPVDGRANRTRMKVFPVEEGRWAAFFYKRSHIPFSTDRYAYGAVLFEGDSPGEEAAGSWFRRRSSRRRCASACRSSSPSACASPKRWSSCTPGPRM